MVVAVFLMGHWGSPNAPVWARARVESCPAMAAHRCCNRTHTRIHAAAREGAPDARIAIGAARCLVLPGRRLIRPPPRERALAPVGCSVLPRVIACARP